MSQKSQYPMIKGSVLQTLRSSTDNGLAYGSELPARSAAVRGLSPDMLRTLAYNVDKTQCKIECSNSYAGLPVSNGLFGYSPLDKGNYLQGPTQCVYKRKESTNLMRLRHWRKRRALVLSRWQERLLESQEVQRRDSFNLKKPRLSITIANRNKRCRKKWSVKSRSSSPCYSVDSDSDDEAQFQKLHRVRKNLKFYAGKINMDILKHFAEAAGVEFDDEELTYIVEEELQRRKRRNNRRFRCRVRKNMRLAADILVVWSLGHINNVVIRHNYYISVQRLLSMWCESRMNLIRSGVDYDSAAEHYLDQIVHDEHKYDIDVQSYFSAVSKRQMFSRILETFIVTEEVDTAKIIWHIEKIFDTLLLMANQSSWYFALYQLKAYITSTFNISVAEIVYRYISKLFENEVATDTQSADEETTENFKWDSIKGFSFKQIFGDWKSIYYGDFVKKVVQCISCVIALGFCTISDLPFSCERFENFYKTSGIADKSWPDLFTCIIETVIMIFDGAKNFFTGKCGFLDIIRSPSASYAYDTEHAFLLGNINLYETNELDRLGMVTHEYEQRLEAHNVATKQFYERSTGPEKRMMRVNLNQLAVLQNKVLTTSSAFSMREAPFSFYTYGKTSVGKTAAMNILVNAILRANGLNPDPKYQVSINPADAYQSEVQTWSLVIIADDIGNTKAEWEKNPSTQLVLDYVNNDPKHALKADVDSKGKVMLNPRIFCASTNVKEVDAHVKSNEPLSILRRLNICITVEVKPEFRKPNSHMLDPSKMTNVINDAWLFTCEEPVAIASDSISQKHTFEILKFQGDVLKNISLGKLISYLVYRSQVHYTQQKKLLESASIIHKTELCAHHNYVELCELCKQLNNPRIIRNELPQVVSYTVQSDDNENNVEIFSELNKIPKIWYYITEFVPYYILDSDRFRFFYWMCFRTDDVSVLKRRYAVCQTIVILSIMSVGLWFVLSPLFVIIAILSASMLLAYYFVTNYIHDLVGRLQGKVLQSVQPIIQHKYKIAAGLGMAVVIATLARKLKPAIPMIKGMIDVQGSNYSTPAPDAVQRDNPWVRPYVERPPRTLQVSSTTFDQMQDIVENALAFATFSSNRDKNLFCKTCIFPLKGNTWLVPYHCVRRDWDMVDVVRRPGDINSNRKTVINNHSWRRVNNTDMAVICLPSLGENKDLTPYFPSNTQFYMEPVRWIHKTSSVEILHDDILAEYKEIEFKCLKGHDYKYRGWRYNLTRHTEEGFCMSPLISKGKTPWIMGFHSAGATGTPVAIGHFIDRGEIQLAINELYNRQVGDAGNINVQVHSSGNMVLDFPEYNIKSLGVLHDKSPMNFMDTPGCALIYGAHTGNRRRFKSDVVPTYISDSVTKHLGIEPAHGPPKNIGNWKPWHLDASKVKDTINMDLDVLGEGFADYERHVFSFLEKNPQYQTKIHPLSRVATLSGVNGCRGIDAIKLKTSAGYPRCKPKHHYVFESEEEYENIARPLDVSPEIWAGIEQLENTLAKGERVYFIHRINLKDEPTKLGKEKVRTFAGCTLECLILIRMYFLPICKMIMDNSEVFECAVGVNAHGPEWTRLTNHMDKHGDDRTIAGDFADYDTRMWCLLVILAFSLLISIAKWAGYNERQIKIMEGLMTELCYGLTEYNGEYIMWLIQNLSGHGLTVFINNIVNSLYMRYSFHYIRKALITDDKPFLVGLQGFLQLDDDQFVTWSNKYMQKKCLELGVDFADVVSLMCYGDDNKMSVSARLDWFNHSTIAYVLSLSNIVYTMADKEAKSVPFINSKDASFLKRGAVWNDKYQQYLAPLEISSLVKTLHSCVKSKVITEQQQSAEALDCVVRELFYHGEVVFEEWRSKLMMVVQECELEGFYKTRELPTYHELDAYYVKTYLCVPDIKNGHASESSAEIAKNDIVQLDTQCRSSSSYVELHKALVLVGIDPYLGMRTPPRKIYLCVRDSQETHNVKYGVTTQNKTNVTNSLMGTSEHQTVNFRDGEQQWASKIEGAYDDTRKVGMDNTVPLDEFFSRPIRYNLPEWVPGSGSPYTAIFNPWTVFLENNRVSNRISNFNLLQCTLKVKFMINGNAFYYGRLMVDYAPLVAYNTLDTVATLVPHNATQASQRLHLYVDPTTSQGGELELPFIWPRNALSIPLGEWRNMGNIYIRELQQLKHANGATQNASLTCYIWAENVRLSVPTTVNALGITTQSKDEYGSKPVSNMATTVANLMGKLANAPVIGPYAKATQIAAGAVGAVAKLFGYSRPPLIEDVVQMKPRLISRFANGDCGDACTKLTLDSKQELSVGTQVCGVDTGDELVVSKIATKETLLTSFPWVTTKTTDQLLWNINVLPNVARAATGYTDVTWCPTACGFAALPFQYWRGTMRYRFQIVCSEYHKGRLRFVYDPVKINSAESNIGFNRIVDLANERDFTIDVSWGQTASFLPCKTYQATDYGTTLIATSIASANGVLGVYVLNDLTTPNSTVNNDIQINVFVSMCDDCEFAAPVRAVDNISYTPQSLMESDTGEMNNAPVMTESDDNVMECLVLDHTSDVYFGETFKSFRSMLKRYNFYSSIPTTTSGASTWIVVRPDYPLYRGVMTNGINQIAGPIACNAVATTLITYLSGAFLMQRGGMRWKYLYHTDKPVTQGYFTGERLAVGTTRPVITNTTITYSVVGGVGSGQWANAEYAKFGGLATGVEVTSLLQQPSIELELPFYSANRFVIAKNSLTDTDDSFSPYVRGHKITANQDCTTLAWIDSYCATAEDFNLILFQGSPPMTYKTLTPI